MPLDGRMIWTDIETFGLVPEESPTVEVGFIITDLNLIEIDRWDIRIWDSPMYDQHFEQMLKDTAHGDDTAAYVLNMHNQNGLWKAAQEEGFSLKEAEAQMNDWLESHGIRGGKEPMCGSSVGFDQSHIGYWWPSVAKRFHYRVVDVSSYKEYLAAKYPAHYADLEANWPKRDMHRALPDCEDTISEFKFYDQNFIGLLNPTVN